MGHQLGNMDLAQYLQCLAVNGIITKLLISDDVIINQTNHVGVEMVAELFDVVGVCLSVDAVITRPVNGESGENIK